MTAAQPANRLFVEGHDELLVLPQLLERLGLPWGEKNQPDKWPAAIKAFDGVEALLRPGVISTALNYPNLKSLGVIVDADAGVGARWQRIRAEVVAKLPGLPTELPADGLVHEYDADGGVRKFGVWIMPDNVSAGMLETFLALFVPDRTQGLWPYIEAHCDAARASHQAPFKVVHRDKALIHSWLAVQDPPGQQMHSAIIQKILVPTSPLAAAFLAWFRRLFDV